MEIKTETGTGKDLPISLSVRVSGFLVYYYKPRRTHRVSPIFLINLTDKSCFAINHTVSAHQGRLLKQIIEESAVNDLIEDEYCVEWISPQEMSWKVSEI